MQIIYESQKSNLYSQVIIYDNLSLINGQREFKILGLNINNKTIDIECQYNQKVLKNYLISNLVYHKDDIDLLIKTINNKFPGLLL